LGHITVTNLTAERVLMTGIQTTILCGAENDCGKYIAGSCAKLPAFKVWGHPTSFLVASAMKI